LVSRYEFRVEAVRTRKLNPYILYQDLGRNPSQGASADEVIADQSVTESLRHNAKYAPLRIVHQFAERAIGRFGLGDLLLLRGSKALEG
jgi:hypothetical protein